MQRLGSYGELLARFELGMYVHMYKVQYGITA